MHNKSTDIKNIVVLGLARTGLIFTRSQERTQLGWLTENGQIKQGVRYHVPPCWVPAGELIRTEVNRAWGAVRVALCIHCFILYILLISIVVVTVFILCCSVKLPLSIPTIFLPFSFHSSPHPSRRRGSRETAWPIIAGHGQSATLNLVPKRGAGITAGLSSGC